MKLVWKIAFVISLTGSTVAAPAQTFTRLVAFNLTDGFSPQAALVQGRDGNLYGATYYGGTNFTTTCGDGCGTVFKVTTSGTLTVLYNFCSQPNCTDGSLPTGLVLATDGTFYGTTYEGGLACFGAHSCGTVFKITPTGTVTTLYEFCAQTNCTDGAYPATKLVQGINGDFYGTTYEGGGGPCNGSPGDYMGCGTVFEITPTGQLTTLVRFGVGNGLYSPNALILGTDGNFYGTTGAGGGEEGGAVFRMTASGKLSKLYEFGVGGDSEPATGLVQGTDGNFYGTTSFSPHCGKQCGGIFTITSTGVLTELAEGISSGLSALIQGTDGNFYGASRGSYDSGTLFQVTPSGSPTTLHNFCSQPDCADGADPVAALLQSTNGIFYGTTADGGESVSPTCSPGCGTVYSLSMGLGPFIAFEGAPGGKVGQSVEMLGQGFTGTTQVSFNGLSAHFTVQSDTYLTAKVPLGATTGYVTVTTPSGVLTSNVPFHVIP